MTRLWLVRHGPTHATGMTGWTDRPADLSDTAALARLSAALPDAPILTSDLLRATATADALAQGRTRLPPDRRLREIHFGAWENLTHAEAEVRDPVLLRAFWEQPGIPAAPGGESWDSLRSRVDAALDPYLVPNLATAADLIVICHFGPILTQVQRALGIATTEAFAHRIEPLSLTRLIHDGDWSVGPINQQP